MKNVQITKKLLILIVTILTGFSTSGWSKSYVKTTVCGKAKVISGDTCSNVKVELSFDGCEHKSEPVLAKRIICSKDTIKARFQIDDLRYEASFEKIDDGWGGVSWKQVTAMTEYRKEGTRTITYEASKKLNSPIANETATKVEVPAVSAAQSLTTPSTTLSATTVSSHVLSPFKFSGYVDIRHSSYSIKDNPSVTSGNPESGFSIEEAAVYVNYEKNKVSLLLDMPIRRQKDIDVNSSAAVPNQSSNANLAIGYDRAQLFLKYNADVVNFYLGQFDTIFGVELNDSKDRKFSKTGIVYDYTLPVTHTGIMIEYTPSAFYLKGFAANPNNKGSLGSSTTKDDQPEYGLAFGYANDQIRSQLGAMTRLINKASGLERADRVLLDATIGSTLGAFSFDLEYTSISDPNKNTLTADNNMDLENSGTGIMLLASYKFTSRFTASLRGERVNDDPTGGNLKSIESSAATTNYLLSDDLSLKAEFVSYRFKNLSDTAWNESRLIFSGLLIF